MGNGSGAGSRSCDRADTENAATATHKPNRAITVRAIACVIARVFCS